MDYRIWYLTNLLTCNLCRQWTVSEMAHRVALSPAHLHKLFKKELGISPILFLRELRLEQARKLLENSYERIKDVRQKVGMIDSSHFAQDFKAKYGVAPSDYRKRQWAVQPEAKHTTKITLSDKQFRLETKNQKLSNQILLK